MISDKLGSYAAARRQIMPAVEQLIERARAKQATGTKG